MKYFALVLLVVFAQPLPPFPRQAINKQAEQSDHKPAAAKQSKGAANQSPPASGEDCDTYTHNTYNFTAAAQPESKKQPESWSTSDTLAAIYDVLTGLLVFVAAGTGCVIWKQTIETRKAAEAALLNTQAVINTERAWIVVEFEYWKIEGLEGLLFQAINRGGTPADIVEAYFDHEFFPVIPDNLPLPPPYKNPIRIPPRGDNMLVTGEKWPLNAAPIHLEDMISNCGKTDAIVTAREILCLFGEIRYRDVLRGKDDKEGLHHTRFCFVYVPIFGMLLPSGPAEYREKT